MTVLVWFVIRDLVRYVGFGIGLITFVGMQKLAARRHCF